VKIFAASSTAEWRAWLAQNCGSETEVWLVLQHKDSPAPGVLMYEAMEQALCFGWIDSQARKRDADSSLLRFSPRNPRSTWSRVNRLRAEAMIEQGLMTECGQAMIDLAKVKGTWQVLAEAETSLVPRDLQELLNCDDTARANFESFSPSSKRLILQWIATAKRPDTRERRIKTTVILAAQNIRAAHPGVKAGAVS
jgi:uncharacterized protein YdeI (YjbR/CyaY-like superfamily)